MTPSNHENRKGLSQLDKLRYLLSLYKFHFSHFCVQPSPGRFPLCREPSYLAQLKALQGTHSGKRCFILAGGPSIKTLSLENLRNEFIISVNAGFKVLLPLGLEPAYLLIEDAKSAYRIARAKDLRLLSKAKILIALHNSYLNFGRNVCFYNVNYPGSENYYFRDGVNFSTQFHHIAFLGGTVTYQALQFAYFLGFDEVILLGVDFSYGERFESKYKAFQGKEVFLDQEAIEILSETNSSRNYIQYKIGDTLNIPHWDLQRQSFAMAKVFYDKAQRRIVNANPESRLDIFPKVTYESLFHRL
jgi:hypothetical protein